MPQLFVKVTPIPVVRLYRASYRNYVAYGRTPREAADRVTKRYKNNRFNLRNILNAVGISLIPFN